MTYSALGLAQNCSNILAVTSALSLFNLQENWSSERGEVTDQELRAERSV